MTSNELLWRVIHQNDDGWFGLQLSQQRSMSALTEQRTTPLRQQLATVCYQLSTFYFFHRFWNGAKIYL
uniref:Uncharacterized protein n=1 Tax=Strigamia maritima TaxID=126957 RepID=T1IR99_STRMM